MITDHGCNGSHPSTITINTTTESQNNKTKNIFNQELNLLDEMISKDLKNNDGLINDVHNNELKISLIKNSSPPNLPKKSSSLKQDLNFCENSIKYLSPS